MFGKSKNIQNKNLLDWEILREMPFTVHDAVAFLLGNNEVILVDVRTGLKRTVAKYNVFRYNKLKEIKVEGIGSEKGIPIIYIDAKNFNIFEIGESIN